MPFSSTCASRLLAGSPVGADRSDVTQQPAMVIPVAALDVSREAPTSNSLPTVQGPSGLLTPAAALPCQQETEPTPEMQAAAKQLEEESKAMRAASLEADQRREERLKEVAAKRAETVSYTHLTLPTICSV